MDLAPYESAQHRSDEALSIALRQYEGILSEDERIELRSQSQDIPDTAAALNLAARIDSVSSDRRRHCMGQRLSTMLESAQNFSSVVDTFVSAHAGTGALVWGGNQIRTSGNSIPRHECASSSCLVGRGEGITFQVLLLRKTTCFSLTVLNKHNLFTICSFLDTLPSWWCC